MAQYNTRSKVRNTKNMIEKQLKENKDKTFIARLGVNSVEGQEVKLRLRILDNRRFNYKLTKDDIYRGFACIPFIVAVEKCYPEVAFYIGEKGIEVSMNI
jgi:hypothetical protein